MGACGEAEGEAGGWKTLLLYNSLYGHWKVFFEVYEYDMNYLMRMFHVYGLISSLVIKVSNFFFI